MSTVNNRTVGASVENALDRLVHPIYKREGLAQIHHEGTRCIPTRNGWKPVDSRPDYAGMLIGSGRSITFDAKHCADMRYHHDTTKRAHQLIDLWDDHRAGGIAGILVVNWGLDSAWWILPQPEWEMGSFTGTMLGDPARTLEVPPMADYCGEFIPDWLTAALSIEVAR